MKNFEQVLKISGHNVGGGQPAFIIAEAGVNHNGDIKIARQMVNAAVEAGADVVKFQTFESGRVVSAAAPKAEYQLKTTGADESQLEMLRHLELSAQEHQQLQAYCQEQGILFLSSAFDKESVDLLDSLNVPAFKIASGEINHWTLVQYIAQKGKPIILSTGMSYLNEVEEAVRIIYQVGCNQLILLHCVSSYPVQPGEVNLRAMQTLAATFQAPVGYSDHCLGIEVALASVALGACLVEKHFTLDRNLPGPDHKASLEPKELKALVEGIRAVECALGDGRKVPAHSEDNIRKIARRSLVLSCDVEEGQMIKQEMLLALRPASGIAPNLISQVVGRQSARSIKKGTILNWQDLK